MQAIINVGFTEYLVSDAKKALAFVEMLQKAKVVARTGYVRDEIHLSGEEVRVEMRVVPATTKIVSKADKPKATKKKP